MERKQSRTRAQGALEYLIIIASVLAIAAIVTTLLTDAFGGRRKEALVSECRTAAAECHSRLQINPDAHCAQCEDSCAVLHEEWPDEFPDPVGRCEEGAMEEIGQPIN